MHTIRRILIPLLLVALIVGGCASVPTALEVSGEALKSVGKEFIQVASVYGTGCQSKQIAATDCQKFREFGQRFQKTYPIAIGLWEAARAAGDRATIKSAQDVIQGLADDLTPLAQAALAAFGGK